MSLMRTTPASKRHRVSRAFNARSSSTVRSSASGVLGMSNNTTRGHLAMFN
jgi:hypothetical protein